MATLISAGAVAGLTTVVLTLLVGATRIIFAMSRDNLLSLQVDSVSDGQHNYPAWQPQRLEAVAPGYLGALGGNRRFDAYRARAGRS